MTSKLSYCGALVRGHDPDRFFLSLLLPRQIHEDLWALFAFNHEIAKTREVVSETQLGLIRLQWWREAIGKIYQGTVLEHEVIRPLAAAIDRHGLKREYFEALIYGREFDLEDVWPSRLEGTIHYADFTATPLFRLAMQVMGDEPEGGEAVQPVAVNYALMGLIRAVPFHAARKRCYLPEDLMQARGVRRLYDLKPEGDLPGVIREVAAQFVPGIRPRNRFLRASQALAELYHNRLKSCGFDPFDPKMGLPVPFKEVRVWFKTVF